MTAVIEFENVGLRYGMGPEILRDLSFTVSKGDFRYITGASGAGKSSLLSLIYLAQRPSRGNVELFGHDVRELPRRSRPQLRRRIGIVFQDYRLVEHLTALENVLLPLELAGLKRHEHHDHVQDLLDWVGLGPRLNARPSTLSGGEQQRVAVARAVILRPSILLADEPTGSVDDRIGGRLVHLFEELNKLGTTVLIATHNEVLIRRFPHPVLNLEDGRIHGRRVA